VENDRGDRKSLVRDDAAVIDFRSIKLMKLYIRKQLRTQILKTMKLYITKQLDFGTQIYTKNIQSITI
jgi:hypothetical protein